MWCEIAIVYDMIGNFKMYKHAIENALKIRNGVEALVIYSRSIGVQPGQGAGTNYINAFVKEHRRTGLSVLLECYALLCDDQIRKFERRYGELTECGRVLENEVQRIESTECCACVGQHSCACQDIINSERPSSYVHGSARMSGKDAFINNESVDFFSDAYGAKTGRATIRDLRDKRYEEIRALEMSGILCAESSADREEAELRDGTANITMVKKGNGVKDCNDEDDVKDRVSVKDEDSVKVSVKDGDGVKDRSDAKDNVNNTNCINNFKTHGRGDCENTNKQNVAERTNTPGIASARNFYVLNKHFYLFFLSLVTAYHQRINKLHLSYNDILQYLSHSYRQTERSLMLFRLALILKQRRDYKSATRVLNVLSILAERTHCAVSVLDVHAQLAHLHFVQGATTECRKLLNAILHVDHHHLFSTVLKMECLYTTDMVACVRYCSRMAGRCVQGEYFLLRCYFSLGMIEQCFDVYTNRERSREYSAECGRTHSSPEIDKYFANTIGIVYFNLKDVSSSMAAFKRALSIDSDFKEARYNLALVQHIANSLSTNDFNVYAFNKTKFKEVMPSVSDPVFLPPYFFINCINK
ncbi:putative Tetratricopeptide-like helical protein [Trachipleistophora hominis]|uniref:Putative Tetratricopeptide-like helical protein n=1 Tax=Trachipleistophora hominis TaxID=72359 RepID=L7JWV0_TRAHO|nr:putative Tetratricopeptide-like helical protein [Trachipleistophora hominis]